MLGNPYNMGIWRLADLDPGPPRPPGVKVGEGVYAPNEAWDDYSAERRELLEFIRDNDIPNVISCSAHTHIFLASEMAPDPDDPASPVVAFDFTSGSLTADPDLLINEANPLAVLQGLTNLAHHFVDVNPMTYVNFVNQGYVLVEVTPCATTLEFKTVNTYDADAEPFVMARFRVHTGGDHMESELFPAPAYSAGEGVTQQPPPGATGLTPVGTDCLPPDPGEPNDPSDVEPPSAVGDDVAPSAGAVAPASSQPATATRSSPRFTG
jgi:alkaline phosphatase D